VDAMTVTIGHLTFEHATYDEQGDVLYLQIGERQVAADSEETPEGHVLRFDATGKIIGLTIINAKWLLDRNGENRCHAARASARRALRARGCVRRRKGPRHAYAGSWPPAGSDAMFTGAPAIGPACRRRGRVEGVQA